MRCAEDLAQLGAGVGCAVRQEHQIMPIPEIIDSVEVMAHEHSKHVNHHSHESWAELAPGFADHLALEAAASASVTQAALEMAAATLGVDALTIVDLGSGTGAGTVALASRFASAQVFAIDISAELLHRVSEAATTAGVADRVETLQANLDDTWSEHLPGDADLVWAALSLHHATETDKVLRQVFDALRPGGVLVAIELTGSTTVAPTDLGSGVAGLWSRISEALAGHAPLMRPRLAHPTAAEWAAAFEAAGFVSVKRHEADLTASASTEQGARYLRSRLISHRERLEDALATADTDLAADLAGLDVAIEALQAGTSRLTLTSSRDIWVAVRP